jgi:ComF family protein
MINLYKFRPIRAFGATLADLLHSTLPQLPPDTIIVPVPTISRHIRTRGFDHTRLIAKKLSALRHLKPQSLVSRAKNTVQVGANKHQRITQAQSAYKLLAQPNPNTPYLIIDDVWTTGSSIRAVCDLLRKNGARHLMVAVLARSGKA